MKKFIIIVGLLLIFSCVKAQVTQEWIAIFRTETGYNSPKKSAIDKFGNLIVAGNSDSADDYVTLKYSPEGNLIWKRTYNGLGNNYDYLTAMILDDSANVYVTGVSWEGISNGKYNWVTIKYKPNGDTAWIRSFDWSAHQQDECYGMGLDKNHNLYIVGFCQISSFQYETALVTIKYNSAGVFQWSESYFPPLSHRSNWGYSVATDDSGNVYSSGYGAVPTGNEIVTIKYDTNGNEKWIKKYPTFYGDYLKPTFSSVDKENNLIVVGYSYQLNYYDIVTLKYSKEGDLIWSRLYDAGDYDIASALYIDSHCNILIGGWTFRNAAADFLILKYAPNGDTLLIKNIDGEGESSDEAYSIASDDSGNIYVTGASQSTSFRDDYLTIKLTSEGHVIWSKIYRTTGENFSYCLSLDNSGSVYVSGQGDIANGSIGIVTIKYSQLTGIQLTENNEPIEYKLSNYPNPFNPNTQINFYIPNKHFIKLILYDISGREMEVLVNEYKSKGEYKIKFNSFKLSSGVYFYTLFSEGEIIKTNKMLLIK